jgi:hypothetical protein
MNTAQPIGQAELDSRNLRRAEPSKPLSKVLHNLLITKVIYFAYRFD